jgi:hypothetical protein
MPVKKLITMKYTEDIFNLLSKGNFISIDSLNPHHKKLYDLIEDNFNEYYDYFSGIGFILEGGPGYWMFTRRESKADMSRKLETLCRWIDYLDFIKTFDPAFGPGFEFTSHDIIVKITSDVELKDKALKLFKGKRTYEEIVEKLVKEMIDIGFVELQSEMEMTYKVTSAYNYIEGLVDCINISEGITDEIPE